MSSKIVEAACARFEQMAAAEVPFAECMEAAIEAALAEARAAQTGEWVKVPREPTQAMIQAYQSAFISKDRFDMRVVWSAMLAASPPAPRVSAEPVDDTSLRALIGEAGNRAHNLACEHQNNEDLARRLGDLAVYLWDLAGKASAAPPPVSVGAEPVVWSEADIANMRVAFSKRFNEPIPRTETLMGVAAVGYRKALGLDPVLNLSSPPPSSVGAEPVAWQARFHGEDGWGPWWDCRESDAKIFAESAGHEVRALGVIAPPPVEASQQQCPCGDRSASACPGEWEPGCDLGAHEEFASPARVDLARPITSADVKEARDYLDLSRTADEMQSVIGQLGYGVEFCNGWASCVAYMAARAKEQASQQQVSGDARIAELNHRLLRRARIVSDQKAELSRLTAERDALLTVRETLKRECEALKEELSAAKADALEWAGIAGSIAKQRDDANAEAEALREVCQNLVDVADSSPPLQLFQRIAIAVIKAREVLAAQQGEKP